MQCFQENSENNIREKNMRTIKILSLTGNVLHASEEDVRVTQDQLENNNLAEKDTSPEYLATNC